MSRTLCWICDGAAEIPGKEGEPPFIPCPCIDGFQPIACSSQRVDPKRSLELAIESLEAEWARIKKRFAYGQP